MSSLLVTGIGQLVSWDDEQPVREKAALVVEGGRIAWVGSSAVTPLADERLDVDGATVVPGFVDSHTHLVFGGDRRRRTRRPHPHAGRLIPHAGRGAMERWPAESPG